MKIPINLFGNNSSVSEISHLRSRYVLLDNLVFALKTLVTSKIYKHPNLITLFDENNKGIRLKFVCYHYATKVKKTKIRSQRYLAA